jgi:hypothetical protein
MMERIQIQQAAMRVFLFSCHCHDSAPHENRCGRYLTGGDIPAPTQKGIIAHLPFRCDANASALPVLRSWGTPGMRIAGSRLP